MANDTHDNMLAMHQLRNELTVAHMNMALLTRLLRTPERIDRARAAELAHRIDQAHRAMIRVVNHGKPDDRD